MKRLNRPLRFALLAALLFSLLCGCEVMEKRTLLLDRETIRLLPEEHHITYREDRYCYTLSGDTVSITYPNGCTYTDDGVTGSWSVPEGVEFSSAQEAGYLPEKILAAFIRQGDDSAQASAPVSPVVWWVLVALGALWMLFPKTVWRLSPNGRRGGDGPSPAALTAQRVGGLLLAGIGIFQLLHQ